MAFAFMVPCNCHANMVMRFTPLADLWHRRAAHGSWHWRGRSPPSVQAVPSSACGLPHALLHIMPHPELYPELAQQRVLIPELEAVDLKLMVYTFFCIWCICI